MNILLDLFLTFAKIGLFTFGGGYAMIALIEHNCVERKRWISHEEMMDITVIAESTPGPIAINAATFIGSRQAGLIGAITATVGIVLPSFLILCLISLFFDNFLEFTLISRAFQGIKPAVGLLILDAGLTMVKKMKKKRVPMAIMLCAFGSMLAILLFSLRISSIVLLLAALGVSLLVLAVSGERGGAEK